MGHVGFVPTRTHGTHGMHARSGGVDRKREAAGKCEEGWGGGREGDPEKAEGGEAGGAGEESECTTPPCFI